MKTPQQELKLKIVKLIQQSGRPVRAQYLVDHIAPSDQGILNDLLTELVAERRLKKSYTLLATGAPDCTYDLVR
jgi:hypothetical protein